MEALSLRIQVNWLEKVDEDPAFQHLKRHPPQEQENELYTYCFPFIEWRPEFHAASCPGQVTGIAAVMPSRIIARMRKRTVANQIAAHVSARSCPFMLARKSHARFLASHAKRSSCIVKPYPNTEGWSALTPQFFGCDLRIREAPFMAGVALKRRE